MKLRSKLHYSIVSAFAFALTSVAAAQPAFTNLASLPGTMEGSPIISSNNPESVSREGLLLSTDQITITGNALRRTLSNTNLGQGCPAGTLKEFAFYMHHLNNIGTGARYYVILEPATAGTTLTFNAYGAAISQFDTGSLDPGKSPSYKVSESLLMGRLASGVATSGGSTFVNLAGQSMNGPFAIVNLRADSGNSVDARVKVRAASCVRVRVVAATEANGSVAKATALGRTQFAYGNIPTQSGKPGGAPCTDAAGIGWGRSAGIYQFERWSGATNVGISTAASTQGWKFLAAPSNTLSNGNCVMNPPTATPSSDSQRSNALGYYFTNTSGESSLRDSDPWSTSNYGAEYKLSFNTTNRSGRCVLARLQLTNYPGRKLCSAVPLADSRSRAYDGAFKVTQNGVALTSLARVATKCPASSTLPEVSTIARKILTVNESVRWDVQTFIPGLISAPAGLLMVSEPSACQ